MTRNIMTEWMAIAHWPDCRKLEKPGIIFELQNASGQSLFTRCLVDPAVPVDWVHPPIRFRVIVDQPPEHSAPLPAPVHR
jgi:hypothetical protein